MIRIRSSAKLALLALSTLVISSIIPGMAQATSARNVRISEAGTQSVPIQSNDYSSEPDVSADGRYVVFSSGATNLVSGDTNSQYDVFVMDRNTHTVTRVSEGGTAGSPIQANNSSGIASISSDGRYVAFQSSATNLVAGDTNGVQDVFVMDRNTHTVTRVSEGGTAGSPLQGNDDSSNPSISADGRYVAFAGAGSTLVAGDTNNNTDIFVMDRNTHTLSRLSEGGTSGSPVQALGGGSYNPSISADGRFVAFKSAANNLITGDTNSRYDIFVMDRNTHTVTRVSEGGTAGSPVQANYGSDTPSISSDGRYVAYSSEATNLVSGDTNATDDIFVMDRNTHTVTRVSEGGTAGSPVQADNHQFLPSISGDGRYVVFASQSTNLVAGDTNDITDVFVMDRNTHSLRRVSLGGTSTLPIQSDGYSGEPKISSDATTIVYSSGATNLLTVDTNATNDIFATAGPAAPTDDNDGVDQAIESASPNSGDANNDGTPDSQQANVTSDMDNISGKYITVQTSCASNFNVQTGGESATVKDAQYDYPAGLTKFVAQCGTPGATVTVTLYYYGTYDPNKFVLRKSNSTTGVYSTIPGAVLSSVTIGGQTALKAVYQITDGGPLDDDGIVDGNIVDPVGLAVQVGVPNTGMQKQSSLYSSILALVGIVMVSGAVYAHRKNHQANS
jgi:Tol biopolymer transport system component